MSPAEAEAAARSSRARSRTRRTQGERSATTRARVIAAAGECVVELGFRGATMTAIAKRAGVTWGAMQHQFGDKDAIFDAVQKEAMAVLEERIADVGNGPADPAGRVRRFTSRAGELLRGRSYRAYLEIQLNRSRAGPGGNDEAWVREVARALDRAWKAAFGDLGLPKRVLEESQRFGFMVLAGMAVESMLFPEVDRSRVQLESLRDTLLRIFEAGGA